MDMTRMTEQVIGAAIEVHRVLGPGLLESTYEACLGVELAARGLAFERQKTFPLVYKGHPVDCTVATDWICWSGIASPWS